MDFSDYYLSLIAKEEPDISVVIKNLREWHCCPRCTLRFLGDKDPFSYKRTDEDLVKWLDSYMEPTEEKMQETSAQNTQQIETGASEDIPTKNSSETQSDLSDAAKTNENQTNSANSQTETVCVSCLGLLQERFCSLEYCQKLVAAIREQDYEFDTYYASLSIPVPLILREYALFVKLKELLPKVYDNLVRDEVTPIKDAWKWANGSTISNLLKTRFDQRSLFEVKLLFGQPDLDAECNFLLDLFPDVFRRRKNSKQAVELFTRVNVPKAIEDMGEAKFKRNYTCPPRPKSKACACEEILCVHESIYIAGRYNKYSRTLSQTPWLVDGGRRTESSVEEMICEHLKAAVMSQECKLAASGREDVDVLMLGRGRPFVVEFINPRRIHFKQQQIKDLQTLTNKSHKEVRVRDLQVVTKQDTNTLKKGEEEKIKIYSALCWTGKSLSQETLDAALQDKKDLVIKQKTPIRVLHRRSLAIRDRTVHSISAKLYKDDHHFLLYLSTQAGTYIKEFVHGDFGRTSPNLGEILGAECDILELNVDAVELDWPKQLED